MKAVLAVALASSLTLSACAGMSDTGRRTATGAGVGAAGGAVIGAIAGNAGHILQNFSRLSCPDQRTVENQLGDTVSFHQAFGELAEQFASLGSQLAIRIGSMRVVQFLCVRVSDH